VDLPSLLALRLTVLRRLHQPLPLNRPHIRRFRPDRDMRAPSVDEFNQRRLTLLPRDLAPQR
jgi:hypothetical protein